MEVMEAAAAIAAFRRYSMVCHSCLVGYARAEEWYLQEYFYAFLLFIHHCHIHRHFACYNLVLCRQRGKAVVGAAGPVVGSRGGLAVGAQGWQWGARGAAPGRSCQIHLPAAAPAPSGTCLLFAFSFCSAVKHSSWLIRAAVGSVGTKRQSFSLCLSSSGVRGCTSTPTPTPGPSHLAVRRQKCLGSWQFHVLFPHL